MQPDWWSKKRMGSNVDSLVHGQNERHSVDWEMSEFLIFLKSGKVEYFAAMVSNKAAVVILRGSDVKWCGAGWSQSPPK